MTKTPVPPTNTLGPPGTVTLWWEGPNAAPRRLTCGHLVAKGSTILTSSHGNTRCVSCDPQTTWGDHVNEVSGNEYTRGETFWIAHSLTWNEAP